MRLTVEDFSGYEEVERLADLRGPGNRIFRAPPEPIVPMASAEVLAGEPRFRFPPLAVAVPLRVAKVAHALCVARGIVIDAETGRVLPDFFRKPPAVLPELVEIDLESAGLEAAPKDWRAAAAAVAVRTEPHGAIYAAARHNGHGHVLLEAMSRCWVFDLLPLGDRLVVANKAADGHYLPWFEALDVGRSRIRTTRRGPVLLDDLLVPSQSFVLDRGMSPRFPALMSRIAGVIAGAGDATRDGPPIYVSRRFAPKRRLRNERDVEARFEERGFRILHPERQSVEEQVQAFAAAPTVAGTVGSGLYGIAFSRPSTRLIVLAPDRFHTRNDLLLAGARDQAPQYVFGTSAATNRKDAMFAEWHISERDVRSALDRAL